MAKIEISINDRKLPPFYSAKLEDTLYTVISVLISMYISSSDYWENFIRSKKLHGLIDTVIESMYPNEDDNDA